MLLIKEYAYSAFATNDDLSLQLGYIILLCDFTSYRDVIDYLSKKSMRVVRSIMSVKVYSFSNAFDRAFTVRKDLKAMSGVKIPLCMFTLLKQLFDALTKGQQTTENRLIMDISVSCQAYRPFDITKLVPLCTNNSPVDGFGVIQKLIATGIDNCPVEQ